MKIIPWVGYQYTGVSIKTSGEGWIGNIVEDGDVIVDCGANRGDWSKAIIDLTPGISKRMIAFEPQLMPSLTENIGDKVKIERMAVGDRNEEVDFWAFNVSSSIYDLKDSRAKKLRVKMVRLDDYFIENGISHVAIIKLDLEGAEYPAVMGAKQIIIRGDVDVVTFEYSTTFERPGIKLADIMKFFFMTGYEGYLITRDVLYRVGYFRDEMEDYQYANYMMVRKASWKHSLLQIKAGKK